MSDTTTADTPVETTTAADWNSIVHDNPAVTAPTAAAAAPRMNLPELPLVVGRLPIRCDTKRAIIQLPQAIKGVSCAAVFPNTSVLSDCYVAAADICRPAPKFARPLNDRDIEVVFWGNDNGGTETGPGWKDAAYPGGQLETRSIDFGVPFVEILLVAGRTLTCGCDSEKWASNDWQG